MSKVKMILQKGKRKNYADVHIQGVCSELNVFIKYFSVILPLEPAGDSASIVGNRS